MMANPARSARAEEPGLLFRQQADGLNLYV